MARPLRLEFPGAVYHLTSRGNARQRIFFTDRDRELFLQTLSQVISRYSWICHAYCLMANHYHLLIETPKANLSLGMRQLNGLYTQSFNRQHRLVGHLFQGRFKAILVEKDSYLLELCRYIVLNPVRVKRSGQIGAWKWSSFRATVGSAAVPEFLTVDWVLGQFGKSRPTAQKGLCQRRIGKPPVGGTQRADLSRERRIRRRALSEKFRIKGDPAGTAPRRQTIAGADLCKAGRERHRPSV